MTTKNLYKCLNLNGTTIKIIHLNKTIYYFVDTLTRQSKFFQIIVNLKQKTFLVEILIFSSKFKATKLTYDTY